MNTCNISPTLRAQTHGHPPCICFDKKDISIDKTPDAILGENFKDNNCVCYTKKSFGMYEQGVGTLRAAGGDAGGGSECLIVSRKSN